jgi:hypothetical protein
MKAPIDAHCCSCLSRCHSVEQGLPATTDSGQTHRLYFQFEIYAGALHLAYAKSSRASDKTPGLKRVSNMEPMKIKARQDVLKRDAYLAIAGV